MKDIKYIIKRVIIGLCIGIGILMFKNNFAFATTIDTTVTANSYYQSQYCEEGETISSTYLNNTYSGKRFSCSKGPSYKFSQYLNNNTDNVSVPALFTQGQLINNFTFEITFEQLQITSTTDRYFELRAPWVSSSISSPKTMGVYGTYLTLNGVKDNSTINYSPSVSTFFNQPQYCSWVDNTGNVSYCNVYIAADSNISRYAYYIDVPVGSAVKSITLYFGNSNIQNSYDLYGELVPTTYNYFKPMTTRMFSYNANCNYNSTSLDCYKISYSNLSSQSYQNYNIYGEHFFSGAGLIYYYYPPENAMFTPSSNAQNIWFTNSLSSDKITYNFSSTSQSNQDYYNNLVHNIDNEVNPQPSNDSFFSTFLDGFTTSSQASGLLDLFNNMFLYPMQKLQTNASVDLVKLNINGDYVLNETLCMKNSTTGVLGEYHPYKVQFYRDYKFNLPCPHTEIYDKLYYGEFGFYGNDFKGASIHTGITSSFADLWLTIQHGFLVYLLFVNCLNLYKYVLDSNKTEIEVLEL